MKMFHSLKASWTELSESACWPIHYPTKFTRSVRIPQVSRSWLGGPYLGHLHSTTCVYTILTKLHLINTGARISHIIHCHKFTWAGPALERLPSPRIHSIRTVRSVSTNLPSRLLTSISTNAMSPAQLCPISCQQPNWSSKVYQTKMPTNHLMIFANGTLYVALIPIHL